MKHAIARIFRRISAAEVRAEQLFEAERLHLEHLAAAELHASLAGCYRGRAERLKRDAATVAQLRPVHSQET